MPLTLSSNNYRDIGIMVYRTCPEIAARCMTILEKTKPELHDVSLIPQIFRIFCDHNKIKPSDFPCLRKTDNIYMRLVFIAIIIKLYNPEVLNYYSANRVKRSSIRKELAKVLNAQPSWVSQKVKIVCFHLDIYDQFANDVSSAIWVLKSKLNGQIKN